MEIAVVAVVHGRVGSCVPDDDDDDDDDVQIWVSLCSAGTMKKV